VHFQDDSNGDYPLAGLIFAPGGGALSLYGTTSDAGSSSGTAFELTSNGGWMLNTLYRFTGTFNDRCGPQASLVMDAAGNLYGTTYCDGANNAGTVFKLTPSSPYWTYTSLHDFTGGSDGANPVSSVEFDGDGNLYGTAYRGGTGSSCSGGCGVVWEITP